MSQRQGLHRAPYATNELTPRQQEVKALLMQGYSHRQIGKKLAISQNTVGNHLGAIFRKLGVETQTEAIKSLSQSESICVPDSLTKRQAEIMRQIAAGKQNKEIARSLTISVFTVERHLVNIYAKLGVAGRAEAVARCVRIQP